MRPESLIDTPKGAYEHPRSFDLGVFPRTNHLSFNQLLRFNSAPASRPFRDGTSQFYLVSARFAASSCTSSSVVKVFFWIMALLFRVRSPHWETNSRMAPLKGRPLVGWRFSQCDRRALKVENSRYIYFVVSIGRYILHITYDCLNSQRITLRTRTYSTYAIGGLFLHNQCFSYPWDISLPCPNPRVRVLSESVSPQAVLFAGRR